MIRCRADVICNVFTGINFHDLNIRTQLIRRLQKKVTWGCPKAILVFTGSWLRNQRSGLIYSPIHALRSLSAGILLLRVHASQKHCAEE